MTASLYIQAFLGLVMVLGLIIGLAWFLKRMGFGDGFKGPLGRRRRLGTIEALMLDGRHKAVLIRRDDVEHLVLIGPNTSQVIERNIPVQPALTDQSTSTDSVPATPFNQFLSGIKKP